MQKIDVVLNDGRTYVQGIQLIANTLSKFIEMGFLNDCIITSAMFTKITENEVVAGFGGECASINSHDEIGKIVVQSMPDLLSNGINLYATNRRALDGSINSLFQVVPLNDNTFGSRSGVFTFNNVTCLYQLLNLIVSTIKSLHIEIADNVKNIYFTGIRNSDLRIGRIEAEGCMKIEHMRDLKTKYGFQSLQRVTIMDGQRQVKNQLIVTFSYRI